MIRVNSFRAGNEDLIVLIGEEDSNLLPQLKESLLLIAVDDWNRELSPWPAEKVFKKGEPFSGEADETIKELTEILKPYQGKYRTMTIAGYSLAGLFALYTCTKTDLFDQCLSASGSLWFPGWIEYLSKHPMHCRKVYLSLGDTEKNTRNPVMASVEDNTKQSRDLIAAYAEVILEMNPGNHFNDPPGRIYKGIQWLYDAA